MYQEHHPEFDNDYQVARQCAISRGESLAEFNLRYYRMGNPDQSSESYAPVANPMFAEMAAATLAKLGI